MASGRVLNLSIVSLGLLTRGDGVTGSLVTRLDKSSFTGEMGVRSRRELAQNIRKLRDTQGDRRNNKIQAIYVQSCSEPKGEKDRDLIQTDLCDGGWFSHCTKVVW